MLFITAGEESTSQFRRFRFNPWVGKISWRRKWQPTPVFLPGKSQAEESDVGCSPWDHKQSDTTSQLNKNIAADKSLSINSNTFLATLFVLHMKTLIWEKCLGAWWNSRHTFRKWFTLWEKFSRGERRDFVGEHE